MIATTVAKQPQNTRGLCASQLPFINTCILEHTHMHARTHTHTHTHIDNPPTCTYTYVSIYLSSPAQHILTCIYTHTFTCIMYTHMYIHSNYRGICVLHNQARTYNVRVHTHTHTHTCALSHLIFKNTHKLHNNYK